AAKYRLFLKWTVLVWLNVTFSLWVALGEFPQIIDRIGIVFGVFSFVIFYAKIEIYLITLKKFQLRKALLGSVYVKLLSFPSYIQVWD
ncbi:MAG: hypothetical protein O2966_03785, partial [Proteobacteria bacterium]|nr:hypothetical protein [Pseudomonadota bacterium]